MGAHVEISIPVSPKLGAAIIDVADRFGVEPWEIPVNACEFRRRVELRAGRRER
jgi:hypothetical protein